MSGAYRCGATLSSSGTLTSHLALRLAHEQRRIVAVGVPDRVDSRLAGSAGPAVVGDHEVGRRLTVLSQRGEDHLHRDRRVGVP